jgi:hypothetical protein
MAYQIYNDILRLDMDYAELAQYFRNILYKRDFLAVVVGRKGAGKSVTAASLSMEIDPNFCMEDMVWNIDQFFSRLEVKTASSNKFGCMVLDDFGGEADAYDFLSNAAKSINHLMQKSRTFHQGFFLTVPDPKFINKNLRERLPDYRVEVVGHNSKEMYSVIKLLKLNTNLRTGFTLYNHLFTYRNGGISSVYREGVVKAIEYCVPSPPKSFFDWYLPFRDNLAKEQIQLSISKLHGEKTAAASKNDEVVRKQITEKNLLLEEKKLQLEKWAQIVLASPEKYIQWHNGRKCLDRSAIRQGLGLSRPEIEDLQGYMREKGYI